MKIKYYFLPLLCFLLACQKETITPTETPNNPASTVESPPIDQRLITQLNNTLVPLSYTNPLIWTAEDLSYFDKLADKKIVGLGEATHGTSEFFKAKFKIFKYLVEHHNYKVFAFEADVGESIYINQAI